MSITQTPSKYQKAIFDAVIHTDKNIVVQAVPGSGKSTTIIECAKLLPPSTSCCFVAFNKSIVTHLQSKLPSTVACRTAHSIGMSALIKYYRVNFVLNEFKSFGVIKNVLATRTDLGDKEKVAATFQIMDVVDMIRMNLTPLNDVEIARVANYYGILLSDKDVESTIRVMENLDKYNRSFSKTHCQLDFTDMIHLALNPKIRLEQFDVVMVDECFVYNQYVTTKTGEIKIGVIVDTVLNGGHVEVLSYNEAAQLFEYKPVITAWKRGKKKIITITVGGKRRIHCTHKHLLLTVNGWCEAAKLKTGDALLSSGTTQPYHKIPNLDQMALLRGSVLGDGGFHSLSPSIGRMRFIHGAEQQKYIEWKASILDLKVKRIEKNGFSQKPAYTCCTQGLYLPKDTMSKQHIIDTLTFQDLAISWMDDGHLQKSSGTGSMVPLATNQYLTIRLISRLDVMLGPGCVLRERKSSTTNRPYYGIYIPIRLMDTLQRGIAPYMHKSMIYKVMPLYRHLVGSYIWDNTYSKTGAMIVTSVIDKDEVKAVYDLEVADNHNFIIPSRSAISVVKESSTSGFIAHNCQDMNRAQQQLIMKLVRVGGRVIAVGDRNQSIYGFAGASGGSFDFFQGRPNTVALPLSISYRLPLSGIKRAREVYPVIEPHTSNPEGEVRKGDILEITSADIVLCRNTLPLVQVFMKLVERDIPAQVVGRDIEKGLLRLLAKVVNCDREVALDLLKEEKAALILELGAKGIKKWGNHKDYITLHEQCRVLEIVSKGCDHMSQVEARIVEMFEERPDRFTCKLMSVHRAKGLECDRVFLVTHADGKALMPSPYAVEPHEKREEQNILFVAVTRHKKSLIYLEV